MNMPSSDTLRQYASILGFSGVGLGAFGAHALKATLSKKPGAADNWRTAVSYQLMHAVALLTISSLAASSSGANPKIIKGTSSSSLGSFSGGKAMFWGTFLFSGSIYCLCLDVGPKKLLGPTTPIGGLLLMTGWCLVGLGRY